MFYREQGMMRFVSQFKALGKLEKMFFFELS